MTIWMEERLDEVIDRALAEKRIVGAVVLVSRKGKPVYERAAGLADREAGRPMALDTVFRFSSVTKPIVAAAALVLAERGVLALEAPVSRFLPGFRPKLADGRVPEITIAQLLTHTSGLSYGFLQPQGGPYLTADVSDGMDQPDLPMEEELRRLAGVDLFFEPGTAWNYSLSLDVLGAAMAAAAGKPLQAVLEETVLGPLGMSDTAFVAKDPSRLAKPYLDARPEPRPMGDPDVSPFAELSGIRYSPSRILRPASFPSGGAGMAGTAGDALKLLETIRAGGAPILSRPTAEAALQNQIGELVVTTHGPGWGFGHIGAVLRDPQAAGSLLNRNTVSWGGVYGHSWIIDVDHETAVVSLTNTAIEGMAGVFPGELNAAVAAAVRRS
jgi:CubicO group peptidase (beta-lactamase class C family)